MSKNIKSIVKTALVMCSTLSILASPSLVNAAETLKWAHVYETSTPYHEWANWAAEEIKKRTDGRYEIKVHPAASLGKENQLSEGLSLGTVDMIYTGSSFVGRTHGPLAIPTAPFMLRDYDHFKAYAKSDLFKEMGDAYTKKSGNKIVSLTYYGQRMVTANKPIKSPADMKDMKLRIPPAPLFKMFAEFQGKKFDGEINYPDSFNIRDYASDLVFYQQAKAINVGSPTLNKEIDKEIARSIVDDDEKLGTIFDEIEAKAEVGEFTQDEVEQEDEVTAEPIQ